MLEYHTDISDKIQDKGVLALNFFTHYDLAQPVYERINGRKCFLGRVHGPRFLKVISNRAIFKKANAWGIQTETLDWLLAQGIELIWLYNRDTNQFYTIDMETFLDKSFQHTFPNQGTQCLCPLKNFTIHDNAGGSDYEDELEKRELLYYE